MLDQLIGFRVLFSDGKIGRITKAGSSGLGTGLLGIEPSAGNSQPAEIQALTNTANTAETKYGTKSAAEAANEPELAAVIAAWSDLPEAIRAGIVAMVEASTKRR